jgi:nucleotide-binding universal stress UspA family protein
VKVLAALDNTVSAGPVAEFAAALARVLTAEVEALHVLDDGERAIAAAEQAGVRIRTERGDVDARLRKAAEADDVVAVVLGRSRPSGGGPAGAVALDLATTLPKPVAVVPVDAAHPGRLARALIPLEGTRPTSLAPQRTIALARDAGLELVAVHVLDAASAPPFTDQPQHETVAWTSEFLARYAPCPPEDVRLERRVGDPVEEIVSVAHEIDADVVALGWSQDLAGGRARIVRAALETAKLPVLLIPVASVADEDRERAPDSVASAP